VDLMAKALETDPILIVMRDSSAANDGVTPLPVDTSRIPNDHLQYAITWFLLAAIWAAMTTHFLMRSRRTTT
jgi:surfeit locus 1 family protein